MAARAPSARTQNGGGGGTPHPAARANRAWEGEKDGPPQPCSMLPQCADRGKRRRGTRLNCSTRTMRTQGREGDTPTMQRATPSCIQGEEEVGTPPQTALCAPCAQNVGEREGGTP